MSPGLSQHLYIVDFSTFCMVDREGTCVSCTIYNIAPGYGVKIGDAVAVAEPYVQDVDVSHKDKVRDMIERL